ncbi:hypothetical protein C8R42DRAFT_717046 [Lentinula raphanica]|nr:hypothetical protein C8R42DRAFT_717046 [Lentinula raphanica]
MSRNTSVAHVPVHSFISTMHLMQSNSLMSSSIQYGIVARSIPLTGKVIKGFLSPSPAGNGLGIGNPNTEFATSVTACSLTSDGGTAKIVWGFRNGEVAVMTALKTMDSRTRSAARLIRCRVNEEHEAEVTHVEWDDTGSLVVSAARDGRIKVWDAKKVRCLWTSQSFSPAICVSLALRSSSHGYTVFSTTDSGEIVFWSQIALANRDDPVPLLPVLESPKVRIPSPIRNDEGGAYMPSSLHVNSNFTSSGAHAFVTYRSRAEFWGIVLEHTSSAYRISKYYSDETSGAVTVLYPCPGKANEASFVIAGHQMGWITVYPHVDPLYPSNANTFHLVSHTSKFEAHPDGSAVTALAWNSVILVTGSELGDTSIFDACSFTRLRVLRSPLSPSRIRGIGVGAQDQAVPTSVNQILLGKEGDSVVASIGDNALSFKADVSSIASWKHGTNPKRMYVGKEKPIKTVKGYEKILVDELITESLKEHDQKTQHARKTYGREREHHANLERLGLSEAEALEYVLMLSRDEVSGPAPRAGEGSSRQGQFNNSSSSMDDAVFEREFDDIPYQSASHRSLVDRVPDSTNSSLHSPGTVQTSDSKYSNQKALIREPREASPVGEHTPSSFAPSVSTSPETAIPSVDKGAFPSISPKSSRRGSRSPPKSSTSPSVASAGYATQGAWRKPLASNVVKPDTSAMLSVVHPNSQRAISTSTRPLAYGPRTSSSADEDIDEDLRLAMQLSLESARDEELRRGLES